MKTSPKVEKFPSLENMNCNAVDSTPRPFDWAREGALVFESQPSRDEFCFWEGVECEGCGEIVTFHNGIGSGEEHRNLEHECNCDTEDDHASHCAVRCTGSFRAPKAR